MKYGKNLAEYFERNNYRKIAIYGMSYVEETLLRELNGIEMERVYAIDKNAVSINAKIDVVSPEDILENIDVIVVTAVAFFDEKRWIVKSFRWKIFFMKYKRNQKFWGEEK